MEVSLAPGMSDSLVWNTRDYEVTNREEIGPLQMHV